jgi:hypothetical protein
MIPAAESSSVNPELTSDVTRSKPNRFPGSAIDSPSPRRRRHHVSNALQCVPRGTAGVTPVGCPSLDSNAVQGCVRSRCFGHKTDHSRIADTIVACKCGSTDGVRDLQPAFVSQFCAIFLLRPSHRSLSRVSVVWRGFLDGLLNGAGEFLRDVFGDCLIDIP